MTDRTDQIDHGTDRRPDARFADADADRPAALRAEDADDLAVVATLTQDAVMTVGDLAWDRRSRRFALLVNRFRWEDADRASAESRPYERVRAILAIGDVTRVRHDGIDRADPATVLSLLSIAWQPGEDGTGTVLLQFAGDGTIAIEVEALTVDLRDVARPHAALAGHVPAHD